jgi:hypothetical protein
MFTFLLIIFLFSASVNAASTRYDFYQNINTKQNYNTFPTNKSLQIYENYSMLDVFSYDIPKPISKHDLIVFVSLLPIFAHSPINIGYLLDKYDMYKANMNTFYSDIISLLYEDLNAETIMLQFIDTVNINLHNFSNKCKSFCLDVVAKAHQKHVFNNFSAFRLNKSDFGPNAGEKKTNKKTKSDIFVSASASLFSGDFVTPISLASDYLFETYNDNDRLRRQSSDPPVNNDYDAHFNTDLWLTYSKLYCINTFSARLDFINDHVIIIGDKIPYEFTANFIGIIQYNIRRQIYLLPKDNVQIRILENYLQQFELVKLLVYKMEEFVVLDIYDKLTNIVETSFLNPLDIFKDYINHRISNLYTIGKLIDLEFPITKMDLLEQQRINDVLSQINQHIKDQVANKNKQKQDNSIFNAEQTISMNKVLNDVKNMEFEAWANLYIYSPFKRTGVLVSKTLIALPEGVAVGGVQGVHTFVSSIGLIFIYNPVTTFIIIFIGLSIVYVSVANSIAMLINFLKWIYWCVSFPFISIYRFLVWINKFK